ncbi:G-protein coupled receptor GRL101-like [Mercenaria mercenaria]|uniref:G-protein coupled receptor GRL101-like n=1 Tax=Mercenaria mercenaria TaxID=6596 RepID=UPI001E1E03E3|nr:G-protein coupled receptor GRL101-like [Mercenaria mercenaria]
MTGNVMKMHTNNGVFVYNNLLYNKNYIFFRYIYVDDYWRGSFLCNLAGVLSTISSEASVLFLCLITLDRLLVIKYPFGSKVFTTKKSVICVTIAWLFSSFIAILPVAYEGYFQNKFYSRSGVCIALPLTRERPPGWVYSISVFVGLNFITFLLVAVGQWSIFFELQKASGMATTAQSSRKRDLKVARNLLLVVATDFMCWFPIGVMGVLALSGHPISGDVYSWAAVFILPVNSAVNPILYTLSAIIGGKDFRPSTKEHSRLTKIKETGEIVMNFHSISRRFASKDDLPSSKYWSVRKISVEELDVPMIVILKSAAQLVEFLDVLHCSCLGIQSLNERSVLLRVRNRQVLCDVKITGEPFVSVKPENKTDDIYRFGILLRNICSLWMKLNRPAKRF